MASQPPFHNLETYPEKPFQKAPQKSPGVLLVHGFWGHPDEFLPLAEALHQQGFETAHMTLPGHGHRRQVALDDILLEEVLADMTYHYQQVSSQWSSVSLVGHSLGGLLSLLLANQGPENLHRLVALASPLEEAYSFNRPWGFMTDCLQAKDWHKLGRGLCYWPEQWTGLPKPTLPISQALPMVLKLRQRARQALYDFPKTLSGIEVPVLLAHSHYDAMVPYSECLKIQQALPPHIPQQTILLNRCGHQIYPSSRESQAVTQRIIEFLQA